MPQHTALETKQKLGAEGAWPIVGCIGRLSEQKAQHYLVEAVALLTDKYPQIKLLLVGEGGLRSFLEKQIQDLGLSSNVSLLGERDDIADLLNVFDVYAMSSRWEGVGRALTEAMHMGLPVVATSVDGVTELISDEKTGLLVRRRMLSRWPPQSIDWLRTASWPNRLGSSARGKVKELMDGQQMVRAIEELYAETKRAAGGAFNELFASQNSLTRLQYHDIRSTAAVGSRHSIS